MNKFIKICSTRFYPNLLFFRLWGLSFNDIRNFGHFIKFENCLNAKNLRILGFTGFTTFHKRNFIWLVYALEKNFKNVVSFNVGKRTNKTLSRVLDTLKLSEAKKKFHLKIIIFVLKKEKIFIWFAIKKHFLFLNILLRFFSEPNHLGILIVDNFYHLQKLIYEKEYFGLCESEEKNKAFEL